MESLTDILIEIPEPPKAGPRLQVVSRLTEITWVYQEIDGELHSGPMGMRLLPALEDRHRFERLLEDHRKNNG